jgi:polysaccharide deacetylase 2 family uncharacterized protein YibQ
MIAIVIDDVGNQRANGLHAVELPGAITYAVLPHTPHGVSLARLAYSLDKEVLIHVPMESLSGKALGPGGLTTDLSRIPFERRAREAINSVPYARGISNHMGSLLTTMEQPMRWLMELLRTRDNWLFLDSRTTSDSVAELAARNLGIRTTSRDVFLDNDKTKIEIRSRFRQLVSKARQRGTAVAIGHPYPETLQVLREELPHLRAQGIQLVSLSRVIAARSDKALQVAQSSGQAAITR